MSNTFKTNSRFAVLMEDVPNENKRAVKKEQENKINEDNSLPKLNSFKNNNSFNYERRHNNRFSEKDRQQLLEERAEAEKIRKEFEEKEKERLRDEALQSNNFPELAVGKKEENKPIILNYAEKIIKEDIIVSDITEQSKNNMKPGWMTIKKDTKSNKIIYEEDSEFEEKNISPKRAAQNVLNALVDLHKKRTREYIDDYGYETWENMFRFPNYDYNYFNRLDEEYEEMMEKYQMEEEYDSEFEEY